MGLGQADLRFGGPFVAIDVGQVGVVGFRGTGSNKGDGCADGISGATWLGMGLQPVITVRWTLPPSVVVRPDDAFQYVGCCISADRITDDYIAAHSYSTVVGP